ncbi:pentatricopeptide repeat-containing protein At5g08305 [Ananas comosus]|uniref:Pentatricopeptide repeat-containing protein At5g08305 n=1 Tax=Ananas comosus TaxID=4615 RepID=A0A6P5FFX8_ANACO|nr:pentatricopeptide repeat-containing protein At5g08305 [Ananas comosus]
MFPPSFNHRHRGFTSLLRRCDSTIQLQQIHAQFDPHLFLSSPHLDLDSSYLLLLLLRSLPSPTSAYNALIRASSASRNPSRSFSLYARMLRAAARPDHLTFPFLAKSCARLALPRLGLSLHSHVAKAGLASDRFVQNSMVHMYAACGDMRLARRVFDEISQPNVVSWNSLLDGYAKCGDLAAAREVFGRMPERDVVSWSAMIDGYVKGGECNEAIELFDSMEALQFGPKANEVTMVSLLCACAHLGSLEQGRRMHRYLEQNGFRLNLTLATSLIDMYAKCGSIHDALLVFCAVPAEKTDVLIWNAMIGGLALHGLGKESVEMFEKMQELHVMPDEITYLGLLTACVHGGLVDEAWSFFKLLEAQGMRPHVEHYACLVDVLGRAGQIRDAFELVEKMPMPPSASVLGALLNSCRMHGWVEMGEIVGKRLVELEPYHDGRYIGLSNIYAVGRRWDEAKSMREVMEKRGVRKVPGFSEIDVGGKLHRFIAHDKIHPQSTEIYFILGLLTWQMKMEDGSINCKALIEED